MRHVKPQKQETLSIHILKLVGLGLLITAASLLSPTLLYQLMRGYLKYRKYKSYNKKQIQNSIAYLKRKKFVAYENKSGKVYLVLTKLGKIHLTDLEFENIKIQKPIKWDNKWRVLLFDIPEHKAAERQVFRLKLREMGFFHFQRSVFVLPYPCEKEIKKIIKHLEIQKYVHLITGQRFPNDKLLKKKFNL
jgi:phenylacetic acid degradation operon negative regulatory protein